MKYVIYTKYGLNVLSRDTGFASLTARRDIHEQSCGSPWSR
jgi:hypothetical protein